MSTTINCPACNKRLSIPDEHVGKKLRCPGCRDSLTHLFSSTPDFDLDPEPIPFAAHTPAPVPTYSPPTTFTYNPRPKSDTAQSNNLLLRMGGTFAFFGVLGLILPLVGYELTTRNGTPLGIPGAIMLLGFGLVCLAIRGIRSMFPDVRLPRLTLRLVIYGSLAIILLPFVLLAALGVLSAALRLASGRPVVPPSSPSRATYSPPTPPSFATRPRSFMSPSPSTPSNLPRPSMGMPNYTRLTIKKLPTMSLGKVHIAASKALTFDFRGFEPSSGDELTILSTLPLRDLRTHLHLPAEGPADVDYSAFATANNIQP